MEHVMTEKKEKIPTTCRVRGKSFTLYVSSMISSEIKDFVVRGHMNILIPRKGEYNDLMLYLQKRAKEKPDHFMRGSRDILSRGYMA
jgi:hypothetical protein